MYKLFEHFHELLYTQQQQKEKIEKKKEKKRNKNKKQRAALIYCHRFLRRGNWLRWSCLPGSITNNNNNLSIHIVIFCSSFQPSLLFGKTSRKSFSWKQHLVSSPKLREESL